MRPRHLLAASAVTLGLLLVPGTAGASEAGCGEADLLEVVTPASRNGETAQRMLHGDTVASFALAHDAAQITWQAAEGVVVDRLLVQAGRRDVVIDSPGPVVTIDSDREITEVAFCGKRPEGVELVPAEGTVELGPATVVVLGEALVIEREATPPVEAAPVARAPIAPTPVVAAPVPVVAAPAPVAAAPVAPAPVTAVPVIAAASPQAAVTPTGASIPAGIGGPVNPMTRASQVVAPTSTPRPALSLVAAEPVVAGPVPLPVGTMEFVVLTCLGMVTFSATARIPSTRRRRR